MNLQQETSKVTKINSTKVFQNSSDHFETVQKTPIYVMDGGAGLDEATKHEQRGEGAIIGQFEQTYFLKGPLLN